MKVVVHSEYAAHTSFLKSIPALIEEGVGTCLHNGRNQLVRFQHQDLVVVTKKFKPANFIQRIGYTLFRPTKAKRAYLHAAELRSRGIETPHEIAYYEQSVHGFFRNGWFVCEECPFPQVFPLLDAPEEFPQDLAAAVARHIALMHEKGIFFGDLNLGNFLYHREDDGGYRFVMVDTNRSRFFTGALPLAVSIRNLRTVTHRRDLYIFILRQYAQARGWDEAEVVKQGVLSLDKFEHAIARKYFFKGLFKTRKQ